MTQSQFSRGDGVSQDFWGLVLFFASLAFSFLLGLLGPGLVFCILGFLFFPCERLGCLSNAAYPLMGNCNARQARVDRLELHPV